MRKIIIANVYRPPKGKVPQFIDYLQSCIDKLGSYKNYDVYIMGDMNINIDDKNATDTNRLLLFIKQLGFKQLIKEPTRYSNVRNTTIDIIITNSEKTFMSGTKDINISDHQLIYITHRHITKEKTKLQFTGRSYYKYDKSRLLQALQNYNWVNFFNLRSASDAWEYFYNAVSDTLDTMCPVKTYNISKKKEPWITNELLTTFKDKDYFLKRAKATNDQDYWNTARYLRNRAKILSKNAKKDYFHTQLNRNKGNSKKFWKTVGEVISPNKNDLTTITLIDQSSHVEVPHDQTANFINTYFTNIGNNLARNLNEEWKYNGIEYNGNFTLKRVTVEEVQEVIKKINRFKSSVLKDVSAQVLKDVLNEFPFHLTHIFNLSIDNCEFPNSWKNATVIPLPKEGNSTNVNNLRPISLLPTLGKLLEKLIHKQTFEYLDNNDCPITTTRRDIQQLGQ